MKFKATPYRKEPNRWCQWEMLEKNHLKKYETKEFGELKTIQMAVFKFDKFSIH